QRQPEVRGPLPSGDARRAGISRVEAGAAERLDEPAPAAFPRSPAPGLPPPPLIDLERAMILERFKVPEKDQVFVSEAALRRTVTEICEKLGVSPDDAAEGADVLTMTDLRGVETHGVSNMLRAYVRDYRAGKLNASPGWRLVRESPGTAVIDAERRLGIM